MLSRMKYYLTTTVPKVCSVESKGFVTSCLWIRGYNSVTAALKFIYFFS